MKKRKQRRFWICISAFIIGITIIAVWLTGRLDFPYNQELSKYLYRDSGCRIEKIEILRKHKPEDSVLPIQRQNIILDDPAQISALLEQIGNIRIDKPEEGDGTDWETFRKAQLNNLSDVNSYTEYTLTFHIAGEDEKYDVELQYEYFYDKNIIAVSYQEKNGSWKYSFCQTDQCLNERIDAFLKAQEAGG